MWRIDNLRVTATIVPEPSPCIALLFGIVAMLFRRGVFVS